MYNTNKVNHKTLETIKSLLSTIDINDINLSSSELNETLKDMLKTINETNSKFNKR